MRSKGEKSQGADNLQRERMRAATAEAGDNTRQATGTRQVVPERKMTTTMRGGRGMVEKEGRQTAENSIPRGKAQNTAPERRKGYFYLLLASIWPTTKGCKRLTRKGVRKRLQALEEPQ